ncbi:acyltransferase [Clostridium sp. LP20]|uniref:acyltransferase n=1 Tax=Clostridium sp. LP20 TaxID=3418665 RepID=UPI003EE5F7BF
MIVKEDSISLLKIFAALLVITLHCDSVYWFFNYDAFNSTFIFTTIISVLTRVCVPLFVLVSGRYLLSNLNNRTAKEFYKTKLPRILIPLVAWNIIYLIFRLGTEQNFTLKQGLIETVKFGSYSHLWYLYLILMLYILTPLINKFIKNLTPKKLMILTISLISLGSLAEFIRTLTGFINIPIYYPVEFIGYYLAGYSLKDYKVKFNKKYLLLGYIGIGVLGGIIALIFANNGYRTLYIWFHMSVNPVTIIGAISLYLYASNSSVKNSKLASLSKYNLGIYAIHLGILNLLMFNITNLSITGIVLLDILIYITITIVLSIVLSILLYKNKFTRLLVS